MKNPTPSEVADVLQALNVPKPLRGQFFMGFEVEWEHAHTVDYDLLTVGKIVLDHLKEDPRYYTKLRKVHRENPTEELQIEIRRNFPDADFWIQRKGSENRVGKPSMEYNPEHFGIKVVSDNVLPRYLYFVLIHVHQKGFYVQRALGALDLKHILKRDILQGIRAAFS